MKRWMLVSLLISGLLLFAAPPPARGSVSVSIGFFHDELAPYGHWVPCAYGECWEPAGVAAGWQPYCNGEWILTDYGWTWVSYDPWGGDPFHYGSWVWLDDDWAWVPGTVWAPAWVSWSWDDDDIGWAPLPPGFAITANGFFGSAVIDPPRSYVFVPGKNFAGVNVSSVRLPAARNATLLPRMHSATAFSVSGGIVRNTGLPVSRVERATGRAVPRRSISAARTDPRPVPRTAANRRMTVAAPASVVRAALGATAASAAKSAKGRRPTSRIVTRTAAASRASAPRRAHPARRPAEQKSAPAKAHPSRHSSHRSVGKVSRPARSSKPHTTASSRSSARRAAKPRPAHASAPRAPAPERRPTAERHPTTQRHPTAERHPIAERRPAPAPRRTAPPPAPRAVAAPHPRPAPPPSRPEKKPPERP